MQWVILIGDKGLTLESIKSVKHYNSTRSYDVHENRYCVEFSNDHIFYEFNTDILNEYDDDALTELKKLPIKTYHFIMMIYTSENRMRKVLAQENFLRGIYVDNDHGLIVPIEEFIRCGMPVMTKE